LNGCSTPSIDDVQERIKIELSKDEILDKIVLIVVCLFCLGTELRFKYHQILKCSEYPAKAEEIRVSSELCHANSIHLASIFIPDECPLISHMINSYKKHHLKNRPKPLIAEPVKEESQKKVIEITLHKNTQESQVKQETTEEENARKKSELI
jgi:hypothetical protein